MANKTKLELRDEEMLAVSVNHFNNGTAFPADIFIRVGEDNYILAAKQGNRANLAGLRALEGGTIEHLHVRKKEFKNFVGQHLSIAKVLTNSNMVDDSKKAEFIARAADGVMLEIEAMGFNLESVEHAKLVSKNITTLVESRPDLFSVINMMSGVPGELLRHSMSVAAISAILAKKMGWTMDQTIEKLVVGALLHDIGLKELPKEILEKPRHELTNDEQMLFETHTYRGTQILNSMPSISPEIVSIVYEHHENSTGQGYPRRLRDYKINPLAKAVALADAFCELTFKSPNNPHVRTPADALIFLEITLGHPFNRAMFQKLKEMVQDGTETLKKAA